MHGKLHSCSYFEHEAITRTGCFCINKGLLNRSQCTSIGYLSVPPGFCGTFFRFLWPKMTDFAAAFLKICSNICGISYCFAVKIYHRQHSFNIVMTFLTSRTIVGLQTNI